MAVKIAINGYGRIGRNVLRALFESGRNGEIDIVAINDLGDAETNAYLTRYDSAHGPFPFSVEVDGDEMIVGNDRIRVLAQRDPVGANLDRIQIVKGWLDADGKLKEKVYDVAWSDDRKPDGDGKLPKVGNTVDLETATWANNIGASELSTVWSDPDFDPKERAFYYARVLEIPTPRWVVYDKVRFKIELPKEARQVHQERAYTSPIWYTPKS